MVMEKDRVLMLVNHDVVIYNFRLELVERLLEEGFEVHISSPYGERIEDLKRLGAVYHEVSIDRHGKNPLKEFRLFMGYLRLIRSIKPKIIFGYTIKPNLYGSMAAAICRTPFAANITGLGTALESGGIQKWIVLLLYKIAFLNIQRVFFQNRENERFFRKYHIAMGKHLLLPGSGVNLERFPVSPYPECGNGKTGKPVCFAFISRIMKEKGIELYLEMAARIKKSYPKAVFHVYGFCEEEYGGRLFSFDKKGIVVYHGMVKDVASVMRDVHCIVHPTFYPEGISNVLLEAASSARPVITTDRAGCREAVRDNITGFLIPERDVRGLVRAVEKFLGLSFREKRAFGLRGRRLVEKRFDRQIVVERYLDEIRNCT